MNLMFCDAAPAVSAAPATTTTTVQEPAPGAASNENAAAGGFFSNPMIMMLLILAIFYFMMIRPQQRKEKERRRMISELRAGAKVVFAGGLMGVIQEATEKTFKIEIASGAVVEVARSCVSGVVPTEEPKK